MCLVNVTSALVAEAPGAGPDAGVWAAGDVEPRIAPANAATSATCRVVRIVDSFESRRPSLFYAAKAFGDRSPLFRAYFLAAPAVEA